MFKLVNPPYSMFPVDAERERSGQIECLVKIGLEGSVCICSYYFYENDIDRTGSQELIKSYAVPQRFKGFPKHL